MVNNIFLLISITFMYSTPLALGALGGVLSERAGVVNIGIEGMMTIGAVTGACAGYYSGSPWSGFFAAGVAGGAMALLHAAASVTCKADQTISGIAINLLGGGLATFFCRLFFDGATMSLPNDKKLPNILGAAGNMGIMRYFNFNVTTVLAFFIAAGMWLLFYKSKWGLRIRAVGEHPGAADTLGIHVYLVRYICVIISGVLAGFGGASVTLNIIAQFTPTAISGQGFIALAAVIFGKWKPHGVYGSCLLFGMAQAITVMLGGNDLVPSELIAMLPYALTLLILILFIGRSVAPKASGTPYEKGSR